MQPGHYGFALNRLLYGSPLRTFAGKVIFAAIPVIVASLSLRAWISWLTPPSITGPFFLTMVVILIGSLLGLALLRYLDRREPEPWVYGGIALLLGRVIN